MGKTFFITGGSSSGKSRWAISFLESCDEVLYISVGGNIDKETEARIAHNCETRGTNWTVELSADNPLELMKGRKFTILDCLGVYTNRIITEKGIGVKGVNQMTDETAKEIEKETIERVTALIEAAKKEGATLLIISTELGFCPTPIDSAQRWFRGILCGVNQRIANISDEVYLLTSGIPLKVKG